jgi:cobyric acid synthase
MYQDFEYVAVKMGLNVPELQEIMVGENRLTETTVQHAFDRFCDKNVANVRNRKGIDSMIAIVDYGLGNVKAFSAVYKILNIPSIIAKQVEDLKNVSKLILPGVGAFDPAMQRLEKSGMRQSLMKFSNGMFRLGICVGMQMLACSSEEGVPGLDG